MLFRSRESLKRSPAFTPVLSIGSAGIIPGTVFCGDRTDYNFRPTSNSVGCGGGFIQYQWAATNGWAINYPNDFYPEIIPNGTTGSLITLTGTYTNAHGVVFPLNTASVVIGYNPAAGTPVFTGFPTMICDGASYALSVADVPGATGYLWTFPAGFGRLRQNPGPSPSISVGLNTSLAPGTYTLSCQAVGSGCANSAPAILSFSINGGPLLRIVDGDASQRTSSNVVCPQNRLTLQLRPPAVGDIAPATGVSWSSGVQPTVAVPNRLLEYNYFTPNIGSTAFTVTASYVDGCGVRRYPVPYTAATAATGTSALANGYSCASNRYRPAASPFSSFPYPNPATGRLQLPNYWGEVVIFNQQLLYRYASSCRIMAYT